MPDFADDAAEAQAQHIADCLARVRKPCGVSATHCDECGEAIPKARRVAVAGCRLCVECQAAAEGG